MSIIIDVEIDAGTRRICANQFRALGDFGLTGDPPYTREQIAVFGYTKDEQLRRVYTVDFLELSLFFGVQPKTLEGWCFGRGQPIPAAAIGAYALLDNRLPDNWRYRVICGLGLGGHITQIGVRGSGTATYVDQIGDASLYDTLDRVVGRYLERGAGSADWYDISWRKLTIVHVGYGRFNLEVEYETGISGQDETEN